MVNLLVEVIERGPQDPTTVSLATMKGWQGRVTAYLHTIAALGAQFERFGYVLPLSESSRVFDAADVYYTRFDEFHRHLLANYPVTVEDCRRALTPEAELRPVADRECLPSARSRFV